ncbi:unnamed protein product [Vitrella brassicaformis CCMP3155]|uniref:Uncharacterized protein n=1 Tax=Vitrella brassicaformis (strain CCMP3155) TaxID=1169540 RepID=A0A0G4GSM1_VITBC|nr:unnamed protein product [Vitrella brassicaformis CCMP3155]|eukprot:CEM33472.1 unnamed protein product [Vitrella brassicaformis CCMP3155]
MSSRNPSIAFKRRERAMAWSCLLLRRYGAQFHKCVLESLFTQTRHRIQEFSLPVPSSVTADLMEAAVKDLQTLVDVPVCKT